MKALPLTLLPLVLITVWLQGCAASSPGGSPQSAVTPAAVVQVFRYGQQEPQWSYKELGEIKDEGWLDEQPQIEAKMIKRAKKMGADAIIFYPAVQSRSELLASTPSGRSSITYYYRATAVSYK